MSARLPTEEEAIAYCESISDLYGSAFSDRILVLCKAARRERRLSKIIEEAPHTDGCGIPDVAATPITALPLEDGTFKAVREPCTCWKRAALVEEEEGP